jgi:hypothetical protein
MKIPVWMTFKEVLLIAAIITGVLGCAPSAGRVKEGLRGDHGPNAPRIEETFAVKEIKPRSVWRIYLNGSDPEGDLRFVNASVAAIWGMSQIRVRIASDQSDSASGYVAFDSRALSEFSPPWLQVWIALEDRAGHRSEAVEFRCTFTAGAVHQRPPEGVFAERLLARFSSDLIPPIVDWGR